MRKTLTLLWMCCACGQQATLERVGAPVPVATPPVRDSITAVERARAVEAAVRFRRMIFLDDTTIRLEGCSVALAVGTDYRALLSSESRWLVSEPATACGATPDLGGSTRRLILRRILGGADTAIIWITYHGGGSYLHEEEFKVRRASARPDGLWAATEMRVYDALIAD